MLKNSLQYDEYTGRGISLVQLTLQELPECLKKDTSFELKVFESLDTCIYKKQSNEVQYDI